jgi:hypothetical protein
MRQLVLFLSVVVVLFARAAGAGLMIEGGAGPGPLYAYFVQFSSPFGEEELRSGDFVTVYDVGTPGPGGTFVSARASAGWATSTSLSGVDGPQTQPNDDAGLVNVTFTYTGEPISGDFTFIYFEIVSTVGGSVLDDYTSQRTDAMGADAGTKIGEVGRVLVPAVPEPGLMGVVGVGVVAVVMRRGRR